MLLRKDLQQPQPSQRISNQQHTQETPDSPFTLDLHPGTAATPPLPSPSRDPETTSYFVYPPNSLDDEVDEEPPEGVWGYLIPIDPSVGNTLILKQWGSSENRPVNQHWKRFHASKHGNSHATESYLIGRHHSCDLVISKDGIRSLQFLVFPEERNGEIVAVLEDLSSQTFVKDGTFVNDTLVGSHKHRELRDRDEVSILDVRFVFRYPRRDRGNDGFNQKYQKGERLGKGHFATVYQCSEAVTKTPFAVKIFQKHPDSSKRSPAEIIQWEIAVLMDVKHDNLSCLRDVFDEDDRLCLVLDLAPDGNLFDCIMAEKTFSPDETRCIFTQLFSGLKFLHDNGIVHGDIKPENILKYHDLEFKLGDFGLVKIIGEDLFTRKLCGAPTYTAPEILEDPLRNPHTKTTDVWSLGVVLYICLCGFPPFSDELNTPKNPYTLVQQIQRGHFEYPSPYWNAVGDWTLDLIDRMLTVDADKRLTVEDCLRHPWTENRPQDYLTSTSRKSDFQKRRVKRKRTMLSIINKVRSDSHLEKNGSREWEWVKIFRKNEAGERPVVKMFRNALWEFSLYALVFCCMSWRSLARFYRSFFTRPAKEKLD